MRVNEGARWFAPFALTSTDKGFRSVVDQIVLTSRKPEVMSQKKLSAKLARSRLLGTFTRSVSGNAPVSLIGSPQLFMVGRWRVLMSDD